MVSQELARIVVVQKFYHEDSLFIGTSHSSIYIILYLFSKLANSSAPLLAAVSLSILGRLLRLDCTLYPTIRSTVLGLYLE